MPTRRRPSNGSAAARASSTTRPTMAPTVVQAMRHSSTTADFEVWTASQATVSSKARVWPAPWRAHGNWTTVGPWSAQSTLGASASTNDRTSPRSNDRHRRRPSPRS